MTVNKSSMLIENLDEETADQLTSLMEDIVLRGKINTSDHFLSHYFNECGFNNEQRLLIMSTAVPQRILLSLVKYYRSLM